MAAPTEVFEFSLTERQAVLDWMGVLMAAGRGWINFEAAIDPESEVPRAGSGLFGFFSAIGPPVAFCTWMPVVSRRAGATSVSVGIQHPAGPKVARLLERLGLGVPEGWVVLQDHPRRGLVVQVPAPADHDAVLSWLLRSGAALSSVPLTGTWRATVHQRP